jgi:hypothetical protein
MAYTYPTPEDFTRPMKIHLSYSWKAMENIAIFNDIMS